MQNHVVLITSDQWKARKVCCLRLESSVVDTRLEHSSDHDRYGDETSNLATSPSGMRTSMDTSPRVIETNMDTVKQDCERLQDIIRKKDIELDKLKKNLRLQRGNADLAFLSYEEDRRKMEQKLATSQQQNQELKNRHNEATIERDASEKQRHQAEKHKNDMEREIRELQGGVRILREENEMLQDFVAKASNEEESFNDPHIIGLFIDLRAQIQHIALECYHTDEGSRPDTSRQLSDEQHAFLSYWVDGVRGAVLKNRLKGVIFSLLFEHIISKPAFGLEGFGTGRLEEELIEFEQALKNLGNGTVPIW